MTESNLPAVNSMNPVTALMGVDALGDLGKSDRLPYLSLVSANSELAQQHGAPINTYVLVTGQGQYTVIGKSLTFVPFVYRRVASVKATGAMIFNKPGVALSAEYEEAKKQALRAKMCGYEGPQMLGVIAESNALCTFGLFSVSAANGCSAAGATAMRDGKALKLGITLVPAKGDRPAYTCPAAVVCERPAITMTQEEIIEISTDFLNQPSIVKEAPEAAPAGKTGKVER